MENIKKLLLLGFGICLYSISSVLASELVAKSEIIEQNTSVPDPLEIKMKNPTLSILFKNKYPNTDLCLNFNLYSKDKSVKYLSELKGFLTELREYLSDVDFWNNEYALKNGSLIAPASQALSELWKPFENDEKATSEIIKIVKSSKFYNNIKSINDYFSRGNYYARQIWILSFNEKFNKLKDDRDSEAYVNSKFDAFISNYISEKYADDICIKKTFALREELLSVFNCIEALYKNVIPNY